MMSQKNKLLESLPNDVPLQDTGIPNSTLQLAKSNPLFMENLLIRVGSFGRYQILLLVFGIYAVMSFAALTYALIVFLISEPSWECVNNSTVCNITGSVGPGEENYDYRCGIPRQDWKFVDDYTSLVTQFDLVCDKASYPQLAFLVWTLGEIVGVILSGIVSDKFGRKITFFAFALVTSCIWLVVIFVQNYLMFLIPLFFIGIGYSGIPGVAFVLVVEYVGIRYRSIMGNGLWLSFSFGILVFAGIGYLVREWRTLTAIIVSCGVPVFAGYCFVPESLRWLVLKKRFKQASQTLKTIARINKKVVEDDIQLPNFETEKRATSGDVRLLFSSGYPVTTLVVWYSWFINGLIYDGVNLSAPNMGGSLYFNWFLSGIADVVSTSLTMYLHNRFGRRRCVIIGQIMAALSAFGSVMLTLYDDGSTGLLVGKILMSMVLAKFFIVISYNGISLMTAELYPTVIRNVAGGSSAAWARIGAIVSVYVIYLIRVHPLLPYGIFGVNALFSGLLCLLLKETNNQPTLDVFPQRQEEFTHL